MLPAETKEDFKIMIALNNLRIENIRKKAFEVIQSSFYNSNAIIFI
jgi:hypothetical protein